MEKSAFEAWVMVNCAYLKKGIDTLEKRLVWAAMTLRQDDRTRAETDFINGTIEQGRELAWKLATFEGKLALVKTFGLQSLGTDEASGGGLLRR